MLIVSDSIKAVESKRNLEAKVPPSNTSTVIFNVTGPIIFNGTNYKSYPSLPTALGSNFSISVWVNPTTVTATTMMYLMSLGRNATNIQREFYFTVNRGGNVSYKEFATSFGISITTGTTVQTG